MQWNGSMESDASKEPLFIKEGFFPGALEEEEKKKRLTP